MSHRRLWRVGLSGLVLAATVAACSSPPPPASRTQPRTSSETTGHAAAAPASAAATDAGGTSGTFKIVFLGDSLTAGLGLLADEAYPADIGRQFAADGYSQVEVVNAGISGDTTAGGVRRLDSTLEPGARIVVVALGGNDALRGLNPTQTHDNLATIIKHAQAKSIQVVLVGMLAPPNLGPDYQETFQGAFTDLAHVYSKSIVFIPFLLDGVAGNPALNQTDGIHPTADGAKIIADHLYPALRTLVDAMQ